MAKFMVLMIICIVGAIAQSSIEARQLACIDEQGNPVDWYMGYKFPKIKLKGDERFESGYSYAYISSKDIGQQQDIPKQSIANPEIKNNSESLYWRRFRDFLSKYVGGSRKQQTKIESENQSKPTRSNEKSDRWLLSNYLVTDQQSVLMQTLKPAYDQSLSAILYNDDSSEVEDDSFTRSESGDDPDSDTISISSEQGTSSTGTIRKKRRQNNSHLAHAKGVLMLDEQSNTGVWLTHSIPRFPPRLNESLRFGENAQYFGQTFMCISFDLKKTGESLVEHLRTMRPQVYDARVSEQIYDLLPKLRDLDPEEKLRGTRRRRTSVRAKLAQVITTKDGQSLNLFSKSKNFGKDIYAGWIDEELSSALFVETWRRGAGMPLNSTCPSNQYHTNNVKDLKYDERATWSFMNDHSKWAISDEREHAFVCIGDTNRMESQFKRGGGAVCIKCPSCWSTFSNTILDVEPCPVGSRRAGKLASDRDHS